ncbi:MAG: DUF2182 domain-containing protein [Sphingomicrobium sp.]
MSSAPPDLTSSLLRHERAWVAGGVLLLSLLCWFYLLSGTGLEPMSGMAGMPPPSLPSTVLMWWLMMGAMMLPSAAPAVMLYAQVRRRQIAGGSNIPASWTFLGGYMLVWLAFSIAAAVVQLWLAGPDMRIGGARLAAAILIAVGVYQWSPVKSACLRHCRSPAQFFARHWRAGPVGAVRLGLLHGTYCVGCCWLLMALLFAGGVMNLALIALLTVAVSAEKLLPNGALIARISGTALIASGIAVMWS